MGLSPRVRGNLRLAPARIAVPRSIPACAGEPQLPHCANLLKTVYPRVCGGTAEAHKAGGYTYGLSPRVRGNRDDAIEATANSRSIPACAGEPNLKTARDPA